MQPTVVRGSGTFFFWDTQRRNAGLHNASLATTTCKAGDKVPSAVPYVMVIRVPPYHIRYGASYFVPGLSSETRTMESCAALVGYPKEERYRRLHTISITLKDDTTPPSKC